MIHRIKLGILAATISTFSLNGLAAPATPVVNEVISDYKVTSVAESPSTNTETLGLSPIKSGSPANQTANVRIADVQQKVQMRYAGKGVSIPLSGIRCVLQMDQSVSCTVILPAKKVQ